MDELTYAGNLKVEDFSTPLLAYFKRDGLAVEFYGEEEGVRFDYITSVAEFKDKYAEAFPDDLEEIVSKLSKLQ